MSVHYVTPSPTPPVTEDTPVLTVESIRALRLSLAADEKLYAELKERIPAKRKRLDAAMMFVTEAQRLAINSDPPSQKESAPKVAANTLPATIAPPRPPVTHGDDDDADDSAAFLLSELGRNTATYPDVITRIINSSTRGLSHADIAAEIEKSELAERFQQSTKAYYTCMTRLQERNVIVRKNGLFYAARLYKLLEAEGYEFPEGDSSLRRGESTADLAINVLRDNPQGMTAAEIKDRLVENPDTPRSLSEHKHYIYNVLSPLVGGGSVIKKGEKYFLSEQ